MRAIAKCDGSGNSPRGSSCAAVLFDVVTGEIIAEKSKILKKCSNNVAEYEGLILALELARKNKVRTLHVLSDSQLIVNQVNEQWKIKEPGFIVLREKAWEIGSHFDELELSWIPREENERADELASNALSRASVPFRNAEVR